MAACIFIPSEFTVDALTVGVASQGGALTASAATGSRLKIAVDSGATAGVPPLPNDTITEDYWEGVNSAILNVAKSTVPATSSQPATSSTEGLPWQQVYDASVSYVAPRTTIAPDYNYATPQPLSMQNMAGETGEVRSMSVVPYDMALGARIMYGLSEKQTATPPPSQGYVNEAFGAQCPMVMMGKSLFITAPRCDSSMGSWSDPDTGRPVMRWRDEAGGIFLGVDSSVGGPGSARFANIQEEFTVRQYLFSISNCLGLTRHRIEENIILVNSMGEHAQSTSRDHDLTAVGQAFFYQYKVRFPNGTLLAQTNMYRTAANQINFTLGITGREGDVVSIATRVGHWSRQGWMECSKKPRGWRIDFPMESTIDSVATVQDLRVILTAAVTLLAFRDEEVASDGLQHAGQGHLYWLLFKTILWICGSLLVAAIFSLACKRRGWEKKMRKFGFRVEAALLPRRPAKERLPVLNASY